MVQLHTPLAGVGESPVCRIIVLCPPCKKYKIWRYVIQGHERITLLVLVNVRHAGKGHGVRTCKTSKIKPKQMRQSINQSTNSLFSVPMR